MMNVNAECIKGSELSFHECGDAFQATDEEKEKIVHFIEKGTTAELIIGDKRIMRVNRSSFIVIEWGYVNDPLNSYAFRWKKYPPVTNPATVFKEFEGSLNLTNEEKQQLRMFIATGDTSFDMGDYRFVRINRGGSMAIEFFKHTEPLVSYPLARNQYSE